ncbi:MAG: hypothetical protein AB9M53_00480 [Leptothrix sp. (in: b-proteobacteria)]
MDKDQKQTGKYDWLPQFMPDAARLIREKRQALGNEWVNECWKRGVVTGEAGWFFAAQNRLSVGVPPVGMAEAFFEQVSPKYPGACIVFIKDKGATHGA